MLRKRYPCSCCLRKGNHLHITSLRLWRCRAWSHIWLETTRKSRSNFYISPLLCFLKRRNRGRMIRCFEHHSSFFVLYIRCFDVAFGWKLSSHCLKEIFCQISTNFKQMLSFSSNKLYYFLWSNIVIFF